MHDLCTDNELIKMNFEILKNINGVKMRCTTLMTHNIINTHPKTRCNWCKKTVKEIIEYNKMNEGDLIEKSV